MQFVTDVIHKFDLVVLVYKCVLFMCFYILDYVRQCLSDHLLPRVIRSLFKHSNGRQKFSYIDKCTLKFHYTSK